MANKSLTYELFGKDRTASRVLGQVGKSGLDMGALVSRGAFVAGAALGAAAVAVTAFSIDSVKAFAAAQTEQNKLNFAYDKFPKLADTSLDSLKKLNSELAKKTRYDDDATAAAEANLAQYQLSGNQIKKLIPLVQDFAARTGTDLPDASESIGKALLGQGRALKAVGIDFQDTGDLAQNYEQIIQGLSTTVGGFAEKDGKTAAGQLEIIQNMFGEIQESAGEAFVPALELTSDILQEKVLPAVQNLVDKFGPQLSEALDDAAPKVDAIVDKLVPVIDKILTAGTESGLDTVLDSFLNDIDTLSEGQEVFDRTNNFFTDYLPRWANGAVPLEESWDGFFNWWDVAWDGTADTVRNKSDEIKNYWSTTLDGMKQYLTDMNMQQAGHDFAAGFALGIEDSAYLAEVQAENMALRARDKVVGAMQIKSPSKVMRKLGGYLPQGFALGIDDESWRVSAASARMAAASIGYGGRSGTPMSAGNQSALAVGSSTYISVRGAVVTDQKALAKLQRNSTRNARRQGMSVGDAYAGS